jgi:hypothetical protein
MNYQVLSNGKAYGANSLELAELLRRALESRGQEAQVAVKGK